MASSRGSHLASGGDGNKKRIKDYADRSVLEERYADRSVIEEAPAEFSAEISSESAAEPEAREKKKSRHVMGKVLLVILALFVAMGIGGLGTVLLITHGPSEQAKIIFTRTLLDTGSLQWVPSVFLSSDEVIRLASPVRTEGGKKYSVEKEAVVSEVVFEPVPEDQPVIELVDISGPSWHGKMMVVRDPSLVRLAVPKAMEERGIHGLDLLMDVEEFCEMYGAIGGITAGGFNMDTGAPGWFVIKNGKIINPCSSRACAVGFTADHRLIVGKMNDKEAIEKGMVDGICWPPILIENGVKVTGMGGGYNPRAAIGQRADGTVILVLIEGRMVSSLGATFDDLADFMEEQGCINACNLDSGRSSVMVYEGVPVTKIAVGAGIQTTNRAAPNAFVVMPEGWTDD